MQARARQFVALAAYATLRRRIEEGRAFRPGERRGTLGLVAGFVLATALGCLTKENADKSYAIDAEGNAVLAQLGRVVVEAWPRRAAAAP